MVSIDKKVLLNCFSHFSKELESQRKYILHNLIDSRNKYSKHFNSKEKRFFRKLIHEFSTREFIQADEQKIERLIEDIGKVPIPGNRFEYIGKSGAPLKNKISFTNLIQICFDYSGSRSNFYPRFFHRIKIRSCVYCNSQLTLNVEKQTYKNGNEIKMVAKYQLDHFYSQDDYPYLSATIFNLYPTCATCNNIKRKKTVKFQLYTNSVVPSVYKFNINKDSIVEYLLTNDSERLNITFSDPDKPYPNKYAGASLEDVFQISSIYNMQKDIVEELLIKAYVYNSSYKKELQKNFRDVFPKNSFDIERLILGNYANENEIHQRPLSKFMQDISSEINRLKDSISIS
jgi:hypothetical protein